ncbi:MAG: hypothetical protein IJC83_01560 [Oscillospiraceae bacterium]|nr:hypothetical protein [Oscillospiraceae bacterium]
MNYIPLNTSTPINLGLAKNSHISSVLEWALNRLRIKKGSFVLDQNLGSELYKLYGVSTPDIAPRALSLVKEALSPIEEITVLDVLAEQKNDVLTLTIYLEIDDTQTAVTVSI